MFDAIVEALRLHDIQHGIPAAVIEADGQFLAQHSTLYDGLAELADLPWGDGMPSSSARVASYRIGLRLCKGRAQ